jgi:hypothetical protein
MDRYIKQIQTRMNRRLKSRDQSVTKQQVRDVYSQVVNNPDKPTDLEISRVTELLAQQLSSLRDASLRDATRTRTQEETIEEKADGRWQEAEGGIREEGQEKEEFSATSSLLPSAPSPLPSHLKIPSEDNIDLWETPQPQTDSVSAAAPQELAVASLPFPDGSPPEYGTLCGFHAQRTVRASEPQELTQEKTQNPPPSNSSQAQSSETVSSEAVELAITQSDNNLPTKKLQEARAIGITQAEIEEAVELAIAQTGAEGSTEAKQIMTELALHLSGDINTLEQAVAALVTGYLNKRSNVLKNAMGALNTLRNAQTNSFCSGLTPDFLAHQETAKKQLMEIANIFN